MECVRGSEEGLCWHLEHVLRNGNTLRIVRLAPETRSLEGITYLHDSGVFIKQNSPTVTVLQICSLVLLQLPPVPRFLEP